MKRETVLRCPALEEGTQQEQPVAPGGHGPKVTIVIAAYNMSREIVRTIRSLSPEMQRGVDADDYELIVVDNGSEEPIDRDACARFGARLRWIDVERPTPSPGPALNLGIARAQAPLVGAMVDGARLASPGMIRHALMASRIHPRAVIATLGFHLGHEPQQQSVASGYDEEAEDALLEEIDWTEDGYRLFDVSVLAGSSRGGWFRTPAESNALFMRAPLWKELGGYDERFSLPGGGLVNLDLFARACRLPRTRLVVLLGEATFHQVHGGASTNTADSRWDEYHEEYVRLSGHDFEVPSVPALYLGGPGTHKAASLQTAPETAPRPAPRRAVTVPGAAGDERVARRYVDLLKKALLNETGLEAEAAYFLARDAIAAGDSFNDATAYDVRSNASELFQRLQNARAEGRYLGGEQRNVGFSHTMVGRARLDNLDWCVSTALEENVPGDLVECGVWRGGSAILMRGILAAWGDRDRAVWVADSFAGLPKPESPEDTLDLSAEVRPELVVSQDRVAANFALFDLLDDRVRFLPGWFKDTLPGAPIERIAVLRADGDYYDSVMATLTALYDRVSPGGFTIIDDFGRIPACRRAVEDFRATRNVTEPVEWIDDSGVFWRRAG